MTQAPTGTTSLLSGVSSGIEPVYDFAFKRKDRLGEHIVYHPLYEQWKEANPNVKDEDRPDYFVSAKQLTPLEHVKMQAVAQKYTDASISKTVNAPNEHTMEAVQELYMEAYKMGCKGVTYYRDGSRDISVLETLGDSKDTKKLGNEGDNAGVALPKAGVENHPAPRLRPEVVAGATYKIKTGYGTMYVTINHDEDGKPFEVFATLGKSGGFFQAKCESICRLVSLALRSGIDVKDIVEQLKGIRGPMPTWGKHGQVLSIPDAVAQILMRHMENGQGQLNLQFGTPSEEVTSQHSGEPQPAHVTAASETVVVSHTENADGSSTDTVSVSQSMADMGVAPECPECGGILALQEGCMTCHGCGYSKCA